MANDSLTKDRMENIKRIHEATGNLDYLLELFGFHLAKREGYRDHGLEGMDAVHFYLIQKYHWLPRDVRAMSGEDIRFVLSEDMVGWTPPKGA